MTWFRCHLRRRLPRARTCVLLLFLLLLTPVALARAATAQITGTFHETKIGRDVTYTFAGQVQTH